MMKIYVLLICLSTFSFAQSQSLVSTQIQKRTPVIEEFTGSYCGSCPTGQATIDEVLVDYPQAIAITYHSRFYAIPQHEYTLDLQSDYGDSVCNYYDVRSFPSITVNRDLHQFNQNLPADSVFGTGSAKKYVPEVLLEDASVNLGMAAYFNPENQQISIQTEVYFTADETSNVRLHVLLLQNNVYGYQANGLLKYPENVANNGEYIHKHVARKAITGLNGLLLKQSSKAYLEKNAFTFELPKEYRGVRTFPNDLELVAFVTRGPRIILNAISTKLTIPNDHHTDLAITLEKNSPSDYCSKLTNLKGRVSNLYNTPLKSFDIDLLQNKVKVKTYHWTGHLEANQQDDWDMKDISIEEGSNKFYLSKPYNINASLLIDQNESNTVSKEVYRHRSKILTGGFDEDFESIPPTQSTYPLFFHHNPGRIKAYTWSKNNVRPIPNDDIGGYGTSVMAMAYRFYPFKSSKRLELITHQLDFSDVRIGEFSFDYALGMKSDTAQTSFEVVASNDCGLTWHTLFQSSANQAATDSFTRNYGEFWPTANEWETKHISITEFKGSDGVIIKIVLDSDKNGINAFFLDNISFNVVSTLGVEELTSNKLTPYPNPLGESRILSLPALDVNDIRLFTNQGQAIDVNTKKVDGTTQVDFASLPTGIYLIKMRQNNRQHTFKITLF